MENQSTIMGKLHTILFDTRSVLDVLCKQRVIEMVSTCLNSSKLDIQIKQVNHFKKIVTGQNIKYVQVLFCYVV